MRLFLNFFKKVAKKIWRYGKKRYFCNPKRNGAVLRGRAGVEKGLSWLKYWRTSTSTTKYQENTLISEKLQSSGQAKRNKNNLQWRVWSWLRMNASGRLNTCKSRGSMNVAIHLMATGARVRNAWATCPYQEDNPAKVGLISHSDCRWHHL